MTGSVRLILHEIRYRKMNFLLGVAVVMSATAIFVAFHAMTEAQERETRRVTRDLGFNLRIIPKSTDMDQFYATGFSQQTMPEAAVHRLVGHGNISYNHLVAMLQRPLMLSGKEVLLTGISPEYAPPGQRKKPMSYSIEPGRAHIGYRLAQRLQLVEGDSLELEGKPFQVERVLSEIGTVDDIRVFANLADVQNVLNLTDQINEIKAIDCLCLTAEENPLAILREELEAALPEAKVIMLKAMAETRARQRQSAEKYFAFLTPVILIGCALCIGALAMMNVSDRRQEIGLFRALGHSSSRILMLFLGKALLIGSLGAILGFTVGSGLAVSLGPQVFPITASAIRCPWPLLAMSLIAAPVFTMIASFPPAASAATQDPAVVLRDP